MSSLAGPGLAVARPVDHLELRIREKECSVGSVVRAAQRVASATRLSAPGWLARSGASEGCSAGAFGSVPPASACSRCRRGRGGQVRTANRIGRGTSHVRSLPTAPFATQVAGVRLQFDPLACTGYGRPRGRGRTTKASGFLSSEAGVLGGNAGVHFPQGAPARRRRGPLRASERPRSGAGWRRPWSDAARRNRFQHRPMAASARRPGHSRAVAIPRRLDHDRALLGRVHAGRDSRALAAGESTMSPSTPGRPRGRLPRLASR